LFAGAKNKMQTNQRVDGDDIEVEIAAQAADQILTALTQESLVNKVV